MGVGSGGKAVPAQKVNPPRFAFGEQARRSEVGGGDGGNDSFAQKFMQHQREHRREQEGSEVLIFALTSLYFFRVGSGSVALRGPETSWSPEMNVAAHVPLHLACVLSADEPSRARFFSLRQKDFVGAPKSALRF